MKSLICLGVASLLIGCASPPSANNTLASTSTATTMYDYTIASPQDEPLSVVQLAQALRDADIILVGEWHSHPAAHLLQAQLLAALYQQNPKITLSMEQFTRDNQLILNDYLAGNIGEKTLIKEANAWPNYDSDYRPLVEFAKQNNVDVIAANAPKSIVRCVGRQGPEYLNKLPPNERLWVARSLTLATDAYQQTFIASMHHGNKAQTKRQFAAQTTWDDTMAESMVDYLKQHPQQQIIHVAGRFHTAEGLGTASRIQARNPTLKIMMVTPISNQVTLHANAPDFTVKMQPLPQRYVQKDKMMAAMSAMGKRNSDLKCY
ncbi:ChaN family lipoprotein [uncultured Photobacterium sp.]|uniref:ChaN family lipoprotein n=1 Tax=uncultured Photobacterium sp. TaxID=173973 RepID=UPI00261ED79A|nr:ChaN family lipoprotein [uncultured Photobacterium sp.]